MKNGEMPAATPPFLPAAHPRRNIAFYVLTIGASGLLLWLMLEQGQALEARPAASSPLPGVAQAVPAGAALGWVKELYHNLKQPLSLLILQLLAIMVAARGAGALARRIGQPAVVGEIVAGIVLGPSLLGWLLPETMAFLFPPESLKNLQFLSQVGLILFMFIIGIELDLGLLRNKIHAAVMISHVSIVFPYLLGVGLAYVLYREHAPAQVSFVSFALFMGIAMSITAFPVLSRIIQERGLTKTAEGTLALTCAATDDVTAWCILATIIAIVKSGSMAQAAVVIALTVAFVAGMVFLVKPLLARLWDRYARRGGALGKPAVAAAFMFLFVSAGISEVIGIHALFGAFLAGAVMPGTETFKRRLVDKIEDVSLVLLLPLFFVLTGLRTQVGLLAGQNLWLLCLLVIVLAVVGKLGGSALAARYSGFSWRTSLSIGTLMNARGLMELIVLNIGYELDILTPAIFSIMVLMALGTTFMTGPVLDLLHRRGAARRQPAADRPVTSANY